MKSQVWLHTLKNHKSIKKELIQYIDLIKKTSVNENYDKITFSDYYENKEIEQKPYFQIFNNNANDFYDKMLDFYCCKEFFIQNVWFQQYFKNDIHNWHYHNNCSISFVYYLEIKNKKESTEFYDLIEKKPFQLDVKEGDIIIFPSYVPHRSPLITTKNRKTILSFNVYLKTVDTSLINIDK